MKVRYTIFENLAKISKITSTKKGKKWKQLNVLYNQIIRPEMISIQFYMN